MPATSAPAPRGGLWAVMQGDADGTSAPEFWHFSGGRWIQVPVPGISADDGVMDLTATPGTGFAWAAVGGYSTSGFIFREG
jgi:hypothetical protein